MNNVGGMRMGGPKDFVGLNGWGAPAAGGPLDGLSRLGYTVWAVRVSHRLEVLTCRVLLCDAGPNINLLRDPRYGRNSELPSEDPLLAGEYQGCGVWT